MECLPRLRPALRQYLYIVVNVERTNQYPKSSPQMLLREAFKFQRYFYNAQD